MSKKVVPTLRDLRDGIGRPVPPAPLTQVEVGRMLAIDQTTLSKIETGQRRASPRLLFRLAMLYGVSYEAIVLSAEETQRQAGTKRA